MSISLLLGQYREAAALHASFDPGSDSSLRRTNRAADRLRAIAKEVAAQGPVSVAEFATLLWDTREETRAWAAFHVLELMIAPSDAVERAFEVLEERAAGDSIEALGTRMRLKELRLIHDRAAH